MDYLPAQCQVTSLSAAAGFTEPGFIFEEKKDGIRAIVQCFKAGNIVTGNRLNSDGSPAEIIKPIAAYLRSAVFDGHEGSVFDGELMPDGGYFVFDVLSWRGVDVRGRSLACRRGLLFGAAFPEFVERLPCYRSFGQVRFDEGVVIKDLQSKYGRGWWKAKRVNTDDVVVSSVDYETGSASVLPVGKVSGVPGSVSAGDIIEVEFFKRFDSGCLRNGRFLRIRDDKNVYRAKGECRRVSASS